MVFHVALKNVRILALNSVNESNTLLFLTCSFITFHTLVVARLETSDLAIEVEKQHAELLMAQANLAELEAGSRPQEIGEAEARHAAAKADKEHLESDLRRTEALFAKKVVSTEEYTHSRGIYEVAVARLKEAEEQLKLIKEGPRKERIEREHSRFFVKRA